MYYIFNPSYLIPIQCYQTSQNILKPSLCLENDNNSLKFQIVIKTQLLEKKKREKDLNTQLQLIKNLRIQKTIPTNSGTCQYYALFTKKEIP